MVWLERLRTLTLRTELTAEILTHSSLERKWSHCGHTKLFHFNKKYKIVVTIKTIITQIERLARNCFSLEFDCKKLGSINIKTPAK